MEFTIRREREQDWYEAELMTRNAFWNLHGPGCSEHLLVHKLRKDPCFLPELSRIAELDGNIAGAIYYANASVVSEKGLTEVLIFGPLCVDPKYQNNGIGSALLKETMKEAAKMGYRAIIIFGEPGYYPRHGFLTCGHFGITTKEGKNSDAFMGIELYPEALKGITGKFLVPDVYFSLPKEEVEEYDKKFSHVPLSSDRL